MDVPKRATSATTSAGATLGTPYIIVDNHDRHDDLVAARGFAAALTIGVVLWVLVGFGLRYLLTP